MFLTSREIQHCQGKRMIPLHQVPERLEGAGRVQGVEFRVWFEELGIAADAVAVGLATDEEYGAAEPHQSRFVKTWRVSADLEAQQPIIQLIHLREYYLPLGRSSPTFHFPASKSKYSVSRANSLPPSFIPPTTIFTAVLPADSKPMHAWPNLGQAKGSKNQSRLTRFWVLISKWFLE